MREWRRERSEEWGEERRVGRGERRGGKIWEEVREERGAVPPHWPLLQLFISICNAATHRVSGCRRSRQSEGPA